MMPNATQEIGDPVPHLMEAIGQAIDKASAESATTYQPGATPQVATRDDFRGLKARPIPTHEFQVGLENRQTKPRAEHLIDERRYNPWEHRHDYRSGLQPSILGGADSWGVAPGWYVVAPPALMDVAIPKRHAFQSLVRPWVWLWVGEVAKLPGDASDFSRTAARGSELFSRSRSPAWRIKFQICLASS